MVASNVLATDWKVPGIFLRASLGVGVRSSAQGARTVILYCNQTPTLSAAETEMDIFSLDDAWTKLGPGSEGYLMAKVAFGINQNANLKAIVIPESAGADAAGTITVAGTTALRALTAEISICGFYMEAAIAEGATPTEAGDAIVAKIEDNDELPVTAANAAGTVTLTAKQAGPRGNHIPFRCSLSDTTANLTVTTSGARLSGGTTSDDPQDAIDATATRSRAYMAMPYDNTDQTEIAKFVTFLDQEDNAAVGNRSYAICAEYGDLATADNTPAANNDPRLRCVWQENSDWTPAMMAAAYATKLATRDDEDPAYIYDSEVLEGWPGHHSTADLPTQTEINTALNSGLTPILTTPSGRAVISRAITTKFQGLSGNPDYRVLDHHKVVVTDTFADDLEVRIQDQHGGTKAAAASTYAERDQGVPNGVTTEDLVKDTIAALLREYQNDSARLVAVEENMGSVVVDPPVNGRFNFVCPLFVIDLSHQFGGDIRQSA